MVVLLLHATIHTKEKEMTNPKKKPAITCPNVCLRKINLEVPINPAMRNNPINMKYGFTLSTKKLTAMAPPINPPMPNMWALIFQKSVIIIAIIMIATDADICIKNHFGIAIL